ncbi:hypothetical protein ACQ4PT_021195 [Festuca glaucescens]
MLRRLLLCHAPRRHYYSSFSFALPLSSPTFAVFGANTGVGKTLVSAASPPPSSVPPEPPSPLFSTSNHYRPASPPTPTLDSSFAGSPRSSAPLTLRASSPPSTPLSVSPSVETPPRSPEEAAFSYDGEGEVVRKQLVCRTLYAWREAVSPHLAAEREGMAVEDAHVRSSLAACLVDRENLGNEEGEMWKLVETAGGVASPGPSVIQGAGGMHMIDPLFQRVLVQECRNRKIPVIFDEVFTGFWRLGVESASELLGCLPDIACYAKLMTGGIVPLAATVTTEAVFEAFESNSKLTALLHGHSYTAHAMGCSAAVKAIQWFRDPSTNSNLDFDQMKLNELWDGTLVNQLSSLPNVRRVVSLGTLCAIELMAEGSDAGYDTLETYLLHWWYL